MSFSILFAILAVLALLVIFAFGWRMRGLKTALLVTGITLVLFVLAYVVFIAYASSVM
jgi:hypothetical protein